MTDREMTISVGNEYQKMGDWSVVHFTFLLEQERSGDIRQ
jgi:hypothetical protein